MSALEREVRLLLHRDTVDLSGAAQTREISDLYLVRGDELTMRIRSQRSGGKHDYELTLKLWEAAGTTEERQTLNWTKGDVWFDAAARSGVQRVDKLRHIFPPDGALVWEIDLYAPPLDFFVIAECEYSTAQRPEELLSAPSWYRGPKWSTAYRDVTDDVGFFDAMLNGNPAALRRDVLRWLSERNELLAGGDLA